MQTMAGAFTRQPVAPPLTANRRGIGLLLAALLPLVVVALTLPIADMPINDSWSYTWSAMMLAKTGRLQYNAWGAPILGFQAYWAGLFIKLFGFSFLLVRSTTLGFAITASIGIYCITSHFRLSPQDALIVSAALVCSPLFIPLAASYMTDVPGLALLLMTVLATLKAISARRVRDTVAYLALSAGVGLAAGSIRQNLWLVLLILLPGAAFFLRSDPRRVIVALVLWVASIWVVFLMAMWFGRQPYALIEYPLDVRLIPTRIPAGTTWHCLVCLLKTSLLLLPIVLIRWRSVVQYVRRGWWLFTPLLGGISLAIAFLPDFPKARWFGWMGNLVTPYGLFSPNEMLIGDRTRLLSPFFCIVISIVAAVTLAAVLTCGGLSLGRVKRSTPSLRLVILTLAAYAIFVFIRAAGNIMFDRYLLPLVALGALLLMLLPAAPVSRLGLVALGLYGLYGIATTHDYFALCRGRVAAAEMLIARGIDRREICAGVEFDGWTQLLSRGHVRSQAVPINEREPRPVRPPIISHFWFLRAVPDVRPRYVVSSSPIHGSARLISRIPYFTWLPPIEAHVYTYAIAPERFGMESDRTTKSINGEKGKLGN